MSQKQKKKQNYSKQYNFLFKNTQIIKKSMYLSPEDE